MHTISTVACRALLSDAGARGCCPAAAFRVAVAAPPSNRAPAALVRHHRRGDYEGAYALTRPVLCCGRDPYALQLLPVHLAAATQLAAYGSEARSDLFLLGHRLTEEHPELAGATRGTACPVTLVGILAIV
jgi:hypothetical protein